MSNLFYKTLLDVRIPRSLAAAELQDQGLVQAARAGTVYRRPTARHA
ncbi:hypothetical protein [Pseudomonas syringae]|nr:hypothetical protein [Pseudomonas syringae]